MKQVHRFLLFIMLLCPVVLKAQHCLSGKIWNEKNGVLSGATIALFAEEDLASGTMCDSKGNFKLCGIKAGHYDCEISMLGYEPVVRSLDIHDDVHLGNVVLKEKAQELSEVVVNADRRNLIKQGAGTSIFRLSDKALSAKNAFEALREIPKLMVNESDRSIKMVDGRAPLILINGINRPGYIHSLNPEDIESVEVMDNPSARYRGKEGVLSVVNIKVKPKKEQNYVNSNLFSRHHAGGVFGITGLSSEVGNNKYSLYLNAQHFYFHNDDAGNIDEYATKDFYRRTEGNRRYKAHDLRVTLGGDWIIDERNYASFAVNLTTNPQDIHSLADGFKQDNNAGTAMPLSVDQVIDNGYLSNRYSLFYRHTFSEDSHLDVSASLGYNKSTSSGTRLEFGDAYRYASATDLYSKTKSGDLELNYDISLADRFSLDFGANTYYYKTKTDDKSLDFPTFAYSNLTEYIYASLRNKQPQKFSYMFSLGLDVVAADAEGKRSHYVNFVPTASLGYSLNGKSDFTFDFQRNRTSPDMSQLNPRNVSIDSLKVRVGNPYLKPYIDNRFTLGYVWNNKGFYLNPYVSYDYMTDQVEETGYIEKGVYTYTYENLDKSHQFSAGIKSRINFSRFGNLNVSAYYQKDIIDNMPFSGNSLNLNTSLMLYYQKVTLFMYIYYNSARYTPVSKITSTPESELTISWNLPKNWQLTGGLRYFAARDNHSAQRTVNGDYTSYVRTNMTDRYLMPMIGISYSFRNQSKQKQRQKYQRKESNRQINAVKIVE